MTSGQIKQMIANTYVRRIHDGSTREDWASGPTYCLPPVKCPINATKSQGRRSAFSRYPALQSILVIPRRSTDLPPERTVRNGSLQKLDQIAAQLGTVRREGLTEQLVQKFEDLVLRGTILPGERLPPERELAEMLGVSRSSLRQALKALQIMGVLEVRQGSGNYLSSNAKEILQVPPKVLVPLRGLSQAELFEVRRALEAESAGSAAQRATAADLERIRSKLAGM